MSLHVECVTTLAELAPHRAAWNRLAAQTAGAQFFSTYDWLETYWRHWAGTQELHVLLVRDGDELASIVPLVVRTERRRIGRLRVLTFPLDDWGSFYPPLGPHPEAALAVVVAHLARSRRRWDVLSWRWLDPAQRSTVALRAALSAAGLRTYDSVRQTTALIDLPEQYADYLAGRGTKFRNNLRRWERRVSELGAVRFVKHRPRGAEAGDADPRWDLYETCERIAAQSWQGASTTGTTLSHESVRAFLRDAHASAVALGAADLNLLYLADEPVAFEYGYAWQGVKFSLRFGYNGEVCQAGLGNLMWLETIKAGIAAGDRTFDLGPGSLEYKRHFATRTADCLTCDHFRRFAPRAQAVALKHALTQWWSAPGAPVPQS